jgi:hypothetical protein
MKKQLNKLLGAIGVSLVTMGLGTSASAADVDCNPATGLSECYAGNVSASDTGAFTMEGIGSLDLALASDVFGFLAVSGLNIASMTLTGAGLTQTSMQTNEGFAFDDLASGSYQVSISGLVTAVPMLGRYNGGLKVVPQIPEPETYALLMAGLLTLGFMQRRRLLG